MEKQYWIRSRKFTVKAYTTKSKGRMYKLRFRVFDMKTGIEIYKGETYKTKSAAENAYYDFIDKYCVLVTDNGCGTEEAVPEKRLPTVNSAYAEYMTLIKRTNKSSTVRDKESVFKNHILPDLGEYRLNELSKETLTKWYNRFVKKKKRSGAECYSGSKLKQTRAFLNAFLEWAGSEYDTPNNLGKVPRYKISSEKNKINMGVSERDIWDKDEFEKFASVIDDPLYKTFFTFLFYTGRREGEVMALSPSDIKDGEAFYNKSVTSKGSDRESPWEITNTKTGKGGRIPFGSKVKDALEEYRNSGYYDENARFLFGGDKPLVWSTVRRRFKQYKELAGVKDIRIHDLRHSFVSMIIHNGVKLPVVAELISDTQEQVMKTYSHLYLSDMGSAVENL